MGGYSECTIRVSVGPIESRGFRGWRWDVANNRFLSITSASVVFKRLPKIVETEQKQKPLWR
jgi:hypothetical protein